MEVSEVDIREVIHTYFTEHSFVKQQMDSCNTFYDENMQKTVDDLREIVITSFDNQAAIASEVGLVLDFRNMKVRICTDYGRCSRPLLVVENQSIFMKKEDLQELEQDDLDGKWDKLMRKRYLEYIDADEEETTMICMTIKDLRSQSEKDLRSQSENPDESNIGWDESDIDWFTH